MPNLAPDAEQPEEKDQQHVSAWPREERCGTCARFWFWIVKGDGFWCSYHEKFFVPGEKHPADRWCKRFEPMK